MMEPVPQPEIDPTLDEVAFTRALEAMRPALRGYVLSIFPHPHLCEDIVQETMLFAWERRAEFKEGSNLKAWVFKAAYFKTLAQRRDAQRDRLVTFSEDVLQKIAGAAEERMVDSDRRLHALQGCLSKLKPDDFALLKLKYLDRGSLTARAHEQNLAPNRLQKALSRLRLALRHCIEEKLSAFQ
ncbi:sigma-70 family RNA polymerase sigma factor [Luteolibacter sp. LG18]|uniref:sigma-70 family RNA polymerase sigma factor n=1 Tax=Luteolibacter sp. LG18 TaxID=2819286 RepID=UPI002B287075|nr:DNA-directed RNA polymerase sigma-70 factor [Luteolibacter sp. LG18]